MLVYIDNIYLKSVSGDEKEHIADIGVFVRVLAEANVSVNMRKLLWVATHGVEVLGHKWSTNSDWKPFDHHIATLQSLPQPMMVSEIWHINGGINAIAEHIPGLQFLLTLFYAATSKERLTKADNAELWQLWADLKEVLLNVESLYIPPPGSYLVLQIDAAWAGVGAVLLAQKSEDPEDLTLMDYFLHVFSGQVVAGALAGELTWPAPALQPVITCSQMDLSWKSWFFGN
ncbi:hypothetical protein GGH12_004279 [Coemansia sp. RSA 1822]|nr:hypothetical protein GGH12_004279 [Coemansia sp. RSA 1822]